MTDSYDMIIEIEAAHPTDGWFYPTLEITFGYEPGPRAYSDERPAAPTIWFEGARLIDNGGVDMTPDDIAALARDYIDSPWGQERAAMLVEG